MRQRIIASAVSGADMAAAVRDIRQVQQANSGQLPVVSNKGKLAAPWAGCHRLGPECYQEQTLSSAMSVMRHHRGACFKWAWGNGCKLQLGLTG